MGNDENNEGSLMNKIHVICKRKKEDAVNLAARIIEIYGEKIDVFVDEESARSLGYTRQLEIEQVGEGANLVIVLGGDGTLLSVARNLKGRDVPILGVNLGGLGFLTEISPEEFPEMLDKVTRGDYDISKRIMLDVTVRRDDNKVFDFTILNDAVITKDALARIIDIETHVNDEYLTTFKSDGLIFSTPTGSTGYSLAAGGPILYPSMKNIIVTPICPHMLTNRPIILPEEVTIKAILQARDEKVVLTLDGQIGFPLEFGDEVMVKESSHVVSLVKSSSKGYFEILRTKLKWGER